MPPDWALVGDDGTFGNRFDDAEGRFRVLYASSTPLGCFIETLARYRKPLEVEELRSQFDEIENVEGETIPFARVPGSWLERRFLGKANFQGGRFADIYSAEWLAYLRPRFEPGWRTLRRSGEAQQEFDVAVLLSQQRRITQETATIAQHLGFDGIYYQSRLGTDLENWALFEPFALEMEAHVALCVEDGNLQVALRLLNLALDVGV